MADQVTSSLAEAKILVMQGMKGDTGEQGPQGVQGETGPQGATGPQGPRGESLRVNSAGHVEYFDNETEQWVDTGIEVEGVPGPDEVTDAEALEIILGGDDDGDEA